MFSGLGVQSDDMTYPMESQDARHKSVSTKCMLFELQGCIWEIPMCDATFELVDARSGRSLPVVQLKPDILSDLGLQI
jgi:hypothetical protein